MSAIDARHAPHTAPSAPVHLLHTDAMDYDPATVIADGLETFAASQGADRVGVRLIGPRHEILAGVYARDRIDDASARIADLNADGWAAYAHAQRVGAPVTNQLLSGNLGTVRTEGIAAYTTLVIDIDPDDGAEPGVAIGVAYDLAKVLVDTVGVPRDAIILMQSGRGAYVPIAIEPQPLSARPVMQLATRTLARMIAAAGEPVHGDEAVFDAPRIIRVPGTVNHKPDADPTTPAWILRPWTPGVRTPWGVVEKLASKARPKLRLVADTATVRVADANADDTPRRSLRELFVARGWLIGDRPDGVADVRCPNADQHTDGRVGAILYPPKTADGPGWLHCSHAHCASLSLFDVFRLLEGRA